MLSSVGICVTPQTSPPGSSDQSIRPALSLGGQETAWEGSPGYSLCISGQIIVQIESGGGEAELNPEEKRQAPQNKEILYAQ